MSKQMRPNEYARIAARMEQAYTKEIAALGEEDFQIGLDDIDTILRVYVVGTLRKFLNFLEASTGEKISAEVRQDVLERIAARLGAMDINVGLDDDS